MDRKSFLWSLDQALSGRVPDREREEMIRYYEEYFDEAGPEGEAAVIENLGDPRELAEKLAAEAGFAAEAPAPKKRRKWSAAAVAVVAVIAVAVVALAALAVELIDGIVDFNAPGVSTAQSAQPLAPSAQGSVMQAVTEVENFRSIDVEVPLADVTVTVGETYGVELVWDQAGSYSLKYAVSGGKLRVTASHKSLNGLTVEGASVIITVPAGTELSTINVETGSGDICLSGIRVRDADCDTGSGSVVLEQLDATEVSVDTGVGDVRWTGPLAADVELNTGMGDIEIIAVSIDGWSVELTAGMGDVMVNGADEGNVYRQQGRAGELEVSTGMGDITLNYGG